jgi:heme exporter protein A
MKLTVQDLSCVRGGRVVFNGLSLQLQDGAGVELTGPNGSGKSSLLRVLAGFIPPAAGSVRFEGGEDEASLGEQCHYVGHLNGVKRALSVQENLAFWVQFLGGRDVNHALKAFDLENLAHIPAGMLSAGQARRLGLARLELAYRPLWLLDEPSVSLDAGSQKILSKSINAHIKEGGMVIAATHTPLGVKFAQTLKLDTGGRQ